MKLGSKNKALNSTYTPNNNVSFKGIDATFSYTHNVLDKTFKTTPEELTIVMSKLFKRLNNMDYLQNARFAVTLGKKPEIKIMSTSMPFKLKDTLTETFDYIGELINRFATDIAKHSSFVDRPMINKKIPKSTPKLDPLDMFKLFNN